MDLLFLLASNAGERVFLVECALFSVSLLIFLTRA